jgi:hypothetical protein
MITTDGRPNLKQNNCVIIFLLIDESKILMVARGNIHARSALRNYRLGKSVQRLCSS